MDDFDYLNGTLMDWVNEFVLPISDNPEHVLVELVNILDREYLPRFEKAVHMNTALKRGW